MPDNDVSRHWPVENCLFDFGESGYVARPVVNRVTLPDRISQDLNEKCFDDINALSAVDAVIVQMAVKVFLVEFSDVHFLIFQTHDRRC